jgi:hypothetical protein
VTDSLTAVREAALDRALVADDAETALAVAAAAERLRTPGAPPDPAGAALCVTLLSRLLAAERPPGRTRPDGRDELVLRGARLAVDERGLSPERAASLANCPPAALDD